MELLSFLKNKFPRPSPSCRLIYNLTGSSAALFLALEQRPFVAVEKDEARADTLARDISFYRRMLAGSRVLFLPDPDGPAASGARAEIMLGIQDHDSIVTSSKNLNSRLWNREALGKHSVTLRPGSQTSRDSLEESLVRLGYCKVPMVAEKGEFSRREWLIDIFPSTGDVPIRIEFFGDEMETIRSFEVGTQRSGETVVECTVFPAGEPEESGSFRDMFEGRKFYTLFSADGGEVLPGDTTFLSRYSFGPEEPDPEEISSPAESPLDAGMRSLAGLGIFPGDRKGIADLPGNIEKLSLRHRVVIIASSQGQSERLRDLFREQDIIAPVVELHEVFEYRGRISITAGELSSGIFLDGLVILTEKEMFGERPAFRPIRKSKVTDLLISLDDISPGDFVVHRDHGIGRFSGVVRQRLDDTEEELMLLEYGNGRLYIPVQRIQQISKYRSEGGGIPRCDALGGKAWQKKKERVRKKVQEMAARLLSLYAGRKVARGFAYSTDTELHREFESFFSYEETPDQVKAILDIKKDMESDRPMDRLLCGDVGYGKTEVAMRAAFKAVYDGRQVAVLVPTTILAEQHFRTFLERFSGFPVTIDYLSRFKSRKEILQTLKRIADGETDITIGTHGLLAKTTVFNRLGLLVVDEEHRFGVGQKEKIKELSRDIDVLNLTATPIPRTLHMALSGIRDISVIESPPEERLAVKSVVTVLHDAVVRDTISAELQRDGQVYFVHNRIQDIHRMAGHIQELVPSARVGVAHGKMPERELERVMHRFFGGELDVLVSTAIIGAGLDIPRANTIIINRADRMGLADLYQLRGRVGRSSIKGYAYFLAPPESLLTEEAKKRLQAVQEMSYLGAGFRLALKDLEIRGAGDVFGPEQSGHIHEIGFELYIEMLETAVAELKGEDIRKEHDPLIAMKSAALIPEGYIEDITLRLGFYRRISSLKTSDEIAGFEAELRDRFGTLPEEVNNLLRIMRLKVLARHLLIAKIQEAQGKVTVIFAPGTAVLPDHILSLHEKRKGRIRFLPEGFELDMKGADGEKVFNEVYAIMGILADRLSEMSPGVPPFP